MRWAVLAIAVVACGVVAALWHSGGGQSTPMVIAAVAIALVCSIAPLALSKRRAGGSPTKEKTRIDR